MRIILDFDDFSEVRSELHYLYRLRARFPKFKVTLFAPPMKSSAQFLHVVSLLDWVQLAVHGWEHNGKECLEWTRKETIGYLRSAQRLGVFVKGFKAPHWSITPAVYDACRDEGYWVADNSERQATAPTIPQDVKIYYSNGGRLSHGALIKGTDYERQHGHISWVAGVNNDIKLMMNDLLMLPADTEFVFIDDVIKEQYG